MKGGQNGIRRVLLTPITLLYLLFLLAPISFFLTMSVFRYSPLEMYETTITGENFSRVLFGDYYRHILVRTFRIALLTSVICLLLGYPLAYFLARTRSALRGVLMFMVIAPLMSGVIVRTYGWIVLLGSEGAINSGLLFVGLIDQPIRLLNTEAAVLIAMVHILLPYMIFPIFSSISGQDQDVELAAGTLGASWLRTFVEITLPLSKPGVVMGGVLVFTLTAGAVVTPALLGGREVLMLGQQVYELVLSALNWPLAAAVASVLVLCQLTIIFLYFRRGTTSAGRT